MFIPAPKGRKLKKTVVMLCESVSTANWEEEEDETWTEMTGSLESQPMRQHAAGSSP